MTPEELDRTMEFIIQHQAHLSAALDQEQETRATQFEKLATLSCASGRDDQNRIRPSRPARRNDSRRAKAVQAI